MSALWSSAQDILIFTKYNRNDSSENTQRQSALKSLDNFLTKWMTGLCREGGGDCCIDLSEINRYLDPLF